MRGQVSRSDSMASGDGIESNPASDDAKKRVEAAPILHFALGSSRATKWHFLLFQKGRRVECESQIRRWIQWICWNSSAIDLYEIIEQPTANDEPKSRMQQGSVSRPKLSLTFRIDPESRVCNQWVSNTVPVISILPKPRSAQDFRQK